MVNSISLRLTKVSQNSNLAAKTAIIVLYIANPYYNIKLAKVKHAPPVITNKVILAKLVTALVTITNYYFLHYNSFIAHVFLKAKHF